MDTTVQERSAWRAVAVPSEHGGWGLTLEPVLLGLLVKPSIAGALLGVGAFVAFLVRTPAKLVGVDMRWGRRLPRTRLATRIAAAEALVLVAVAAAVTALSGWEWWVPVIVAAPLVAVQMTYDVRSHGRRTAPELCGAIGVCAVVAAMVLAGGGGGRLAAALWIVLAARALGAIPFVRTQIMRLRRGAADLRSADLALAASAAFAGLGLALEPSVWAGFVGVVGLAALQARWLRRPPVPAKVLGMRQMLLGLLVVVATAASVGMA